VKKYIRIELVDNEIKLQAMLEDKRLGVINDKNILEVDDNPKLPSGVSIGPKMVKDFIKSYEVIERDGKTTIVHATLVNGYKITEASSCVDPSNYSKEIGTEICLEKIVNQVWGLLGFLLQTAFNGAKQKKVHYKGLIHNA